MSDTPIAPAPPPERVQPGAAHLLRAERAARGEGRVHRRPPNADLRRIWRRACARFATVLRASGLQREERVLLLAHDTARLARRVPRRACTPASCPVAVNTLLTTADYAYMLEHSRARAAIVSAALSPVLRAGAAARRRTTLRPPWSSTRRADSAAGSRDFAALTSPPRSQLQRPRRPRAPTTRRSGSTRRAPPARPRARCTRMRTLYWTDALYGRNVLRA